MKDTIPHLYSTCHGKHSSPVISTAWPQPWSRGQTSAYNWRNTPSELYDFHSQSQGRCWYFRTALETLSTQIGGECSSLPREKRLFDLLGVRIWQWIYVECILTTRDLTSWSQPYRDDKCTKQSLYSVWILPVNYKRIMNRHARRIDPRVDKLASETHGPSCSDYRVAWDFDSPWITGPMTAHQSVAHVRHIKEAPAANLCILSAIVFLPIKAWIWRHIHRYLDGSAIFCWLSTDLYARPVWPRWLKISPCVTTKVMWSETTFR